MRPTPASRDISTTGTPDRAPFCCVRLPSEAFGQVYVFMTYYQASFQPGPTVLLTGHPDRRQALAVRLFNDLAGLGIRVEILAESQVRQTFWPELGDSLPDRMKSLERLGVLCLLLNQQGVLVLMDAGEIPQDILRAWQERLPHLVESPTPSATDSGPGDPENAARLILNRLLESGLIEVTGQGNLSPEDRVALEKRLRDLGYL